MHILAIRQPPKEYFEILTSFGDITSSNAINEQARSKRKN